VREEVEAQPKWLTSSRREMGFDWQIERHRGETWTIERRSTGLLERPMRLASYNARREATTQ
jgi:hypothetical protein